MHKLLFGTAGIPASTRKPSTESGIAQVRALGLDCMELEFVHTVTISKEKAPLIKRVAQDNDVVLTCHGPYYINLNALEKQKREASKQRMISASRRAWECGAWSIAFHLGFYLGKDKATVYGTIKQELNEVTKVLHDEGVGITLRAETTGKPTQFGDLDELLHIAQETSVMPCIDFAHLHARTNGKVNTYDEFTDVLTKVEVKLGKDGLRNMHIHLAGIAYSIKGERNHLNLKDSDMNYESISKAWNDFGIAGTVICESPNSEEDALLLKKTYTG